MTTEESTKTGEPAKSATTDFTSGIEQTAKAENIRPEVTASAIARMMGVATTTELQLLEGKIDLVSTKLATINVRFDKVLSLFNQLPTGSDLERIDVQIGALKALIKDLTLIVTGDKLDGKTSSAGQKGTKATTIVEAEEEAELPASETP